MVIGQSGLRGNQIADHMGLLAPIKAQRPPTIENFFLNFFVYLFKGKLGILIKFIFFIIICFDSPPPDNKKN